MAQTTRQFKAEIAEQARMKAEEVISREIGVPATAVKAIKGVTTKAERATIARYPAEQPWMVTVEFDLAAAAAITPDTATVVAERVNFATLKPLVGFKVTIVEHVRTAQNRNVNGVLVGLDSVEAHVAVPYGKGERVRNVALWQIVSATPTETDEERRARVGLDCGADYCVDPGNCAKHDSPDAGPTTSDDQSFGEPEAPVQHLNQDGRKVTLCGKPFATIAGSVYDHREGFAPTGLRCDECADEADALQNGRPSRPTRQYDIHNPADVAELDRNAELRAAAIVRATMRTAAPGERFEFVAKLGSRFEATIVSAHEFAGEDFVNVKDATTQIRYELRVREGVYRMPANRIASMTLIAPERPERNIRQIHDALAAAWTGSLHRVTLATGQSFDAIYDGQRYVEPAGVLFALPTDATTIPAFLEIYRQGGLGISATHYLIPVADLAGLVKSKPAAIDEAALVRATIRVEGIVEALKRAPTVESLAVIERELHEAANAVHWTYVRPGVALGAARDRIGAPRASTAGTDDLWARESERMADKLGRR